MKKEILSKFIILAFVATVAILFFREGARKSNIQKHGGITICKLTLCEQRGKNSVAFVKYYVNGRKYRTMAGGCPDGGSEKLNRFFSMKYNKGNPSNIVVDFSSEVNDSALIKELEGKIKFSMYD